MDLPTYTNIWRIEKRLYKLYDFRLPMPLPINWIAVFAGITIPYIVFLIAIGLPFNHTLIWLYVLPPGLITWLTTRPVIENKRLPELLESQVRYLTEPRTWVRFAPLTEKEQVVVTARVWHSSQPAVGLAAENGQPAVVDQEGNAAQAPRTPNRVGRPATAGKRKAAPGKTARTRLSVRGLGGPQSAPVPPAVPMSTVASAQPRTSWPSAQPTRPLPDVASPQPAGAPLPAVHRPSAGPRLAEGMPMRGRGGTPAGARLEMSHDGPGRRPVMVVPPAPPVRPAPPVSSVSAWPAPARPLRPVRRPPQDMLPPEPVQLSEPVQPSAPALPSEQTPDIAARVTSAPDSDEIAHQPEPEPAVESEVEPEVEPQAAAGPELANEPKPAPAAEPELPYDHEPEAVEPAPELASWPEPVPIRQPFYQPEPAYQPEPPRQSDAARQALLERAHEPASARYPAAYGPPVPVAGPGIAESPAVAGEPDPLAGSAGDATTDGDETAGPAASAAPSQPARVIQPPETVQPETAQPPGTAQPAGVTASVDETARRAVPSIERALSGPSRDRNLSWNGTVKIVTGAGAGAAQGPGARDQEGLDRNRARLPIAAPRRILILGCTAGAGQTVTALMVGYMLASLREQPVAAVDLHDGTLARYRAPAAWLDEILAGKPPQAARPARADGLPPTVKASAARLDVIASHEPLGDGDEIKLAVQLSRHYPLAVLDGGPAGLAKLLRVTDQLVFVAPANVEAAGALADTRDWLDAHGHADLAMQSVTVINGVSRRSLPDVEQAESIARGRSRAIVRVPWDDMLPVATTGPSTLRPQTRVAYTALAGVLVAGLAAAPAKTAAPVRKQQ